MLGEVNFLCHIINKDGLRPQNGKVKEFFKFTSPACANKVKSFLEKVSFFRKFVPKFLDYAASFFDLPRKMVNFVGHLSVKLSLSTLKINCRTPTTSIYLDFTKPFIIHS